MNFTNNIVEKQSTVFIISTQYNKLDDYLQHEYSTPSKNLHLTLISHVYSSVNKYVCIIFMHLVSHSIKTSVTIYFNALNNACFFNKACFHCNK